VGSVCGYSRCSAVIQSVCFPLPPWLCLKLIQKQRMRGQQPVKEIVDAARETFKQKLVVFDSILGKQKYMGGDAFSLVDVFYLPWAQKLFQTGEGPAIEAHPNVKAWWERVSTRDSWKATLAYGAQV